jgi:hypothetical protein
VQSQHIVKNRILRQLSADELKNIQPWLTPMELRSNVVLHEQGAAIDHISQVYSAHKCVLKEGREPRLRRGPMYYNFVRIHQTLKVTPAMAAGVTDRLWEMSDVVDLLEAFEAARKRCLTEAAYSFCWSAKRCQICAISSSVVRASAPWTVRSLQALLREASVTYARGLLVQHRWSLRLMVSRVCAK